MQLRFSQSETHFFFHTGNRNRSPVRSANDFYLIVALPLNFKYVHIPPVITVRTHLPCGIFPIVLIILLSILSLEIGGLVRSGWGFKRLILLARVDILADIIGN